MAVTTNSTRSCSSSIVAGDATDDQQSDVELMSSCDVNADKTNGARQEKINKLVSEGAKNYPAYLKLIYTGESELSSEDECDKTKHHQQRHRRCHDVVGKHAETRTSRDSGVISIPAESNKLLDTGREKVDSPHSSADGFETYDLTPTSDVRGIGGNIGYVTTASTCDTSKNDADQQVEQWQLELLKIEDDIATMRGVLNAKLEIAADLKRKLGITAFVEWKHSVRHFKLHSDTLQKTNAAFKNLGKKMANFRQRTSAAFKPTAAADGNGVDSSNGSNGTHQDAQKQMYDGLQLVSSKSDTNVTDFNKRHIFRR